MYDSPYLCDSKTFKNFVDQPILQNFPPPFYLSNELCISFPEELSKIAGKKVLVVGGGPSAIDHKWEESNYDFLVMSNHFFLNDRLKKLNPLFSTVSQDTNILSNEFQTYLKNSTTLFVFEDAFRRPDFIRGAIKHYPGRFGVSMVRFHGKIGTGARLLIMCSEFNPHSIDFIGIDGYPPGTKEGDSLRHAYEQDKVPRGTFNMEWFEQDYGLLYEHLKMYPAISYKNLGHGHPYNVFTRLGFFE